MEIMDVDDANILSTIFKESFPESWRENPDFAQYLTELSSYGVDQLGREPDRLSEERASISEQTQDLAFHNYKTFIQTAECSREIFQDFQIIESHVGSLVEKLPLLSEDCSSFLKKAQEISTSRRMNNLTLARHTQILEVLEIPQLMDTCVRNGYYEEALELGAYVKRLEKKHSNIPVIVNIVNEVKHCMFIMLSQLIQQLRTSIQLPACLRIIGYLRRMDVFTEAELRIKFLQARDTWFQSKLNAIPNDDAYSHITKTIEESRVHLYDIITQYKAIFSDEDPMLMVSPDEMPVLSTLFYSWVNTKITQFLKTLKEDLKRKMNGRLDSVLDQCMYFGLSFSRVGADFRGLLAPLFQEAALKSFQEFINDANTKFDEAMKSYTFLGATSILPNSALSLASQGSSSYHPPPIILMEFTPLAVFCNDILNALNELRICAPLSLAIHIASKVQFSLLSAANVILAYHKAENTTFNKDEKNRFTEFCRVFCEDLVSHMNKCLQIMNPTSQIAQALGISTIDFVKMGSIGSIDIKVVNEPLTELMPIKHNDSIEPTLLGFTSESIVDEKEDKESNDTVTKVELTYNVGAPSLSSDSNIKQLDKDNNGVTSDNIGGENDEKRNDTITKIELPDIVYAPSLSTEDNPKQLDIDKDVPTLDNIGGEHDDEKRNDTITEDDMANSSLPPLSTEDNHKHLDIDKDCFTSDSIDGENEYEKRSDTITEVDIVDIASSVSVSIESNSKHSDINSSVNDSLNNSCDKNLIGNMSPERNDDTPLESFEVTVALDNSSQFSELAQNMSSMSSPDINVLTDYVSCTVDQESLPSGHENLAPIEESEISVIKESHNEQISLSNKED